MADDRPVVWICTPLRSFNCEGKLTQEAFETLGEHYKEPIRQLSLHPDLPWRIELNITGGGGVIRARNRFASDFMAKTSNPNDRLFFVDYDLMPTAQNYVDILLHDLDVVGGMYTTRADNGHWVLNKLSGVAPHRNGLLQVMELGTGFKCFKRACFQKTLDKNPWLDCESDFDHRKRELGFFSAGPVWDKQLWPGRGRWLTEDYWYDWICRDCDIPIVAQTKIKLYHKDDFSGKVYPAQFPPDPGLMPSEAIEP